MVYQDWNIEFLINIQPHKNMLIVLLGIFCANIKTTTVYHRFWHGPQSKAVNKVRLYILYILLLLFLVDHEKPIVDCGFYLIQLKKHH